MKKEDSNNEANNQENFSKSLSVNKPRDQNNLYLINKFKGVL